MRFDITLSPSGSSLIAEENSQRSEKCGGGSFRNCMKKSSRRYMREKRPESKDKRFRTLMSFTKGSKRARDSEQFRHLRVCSVRTFQQF